MAIKFRCSHCRQFLGIAQSKAGQIVDCPRCRRSLRVPQASGRIDANPNSDSVMQNSDVAHALDVGGAEPRHGDSGPNPSVAKGDDVFSPPPLSEPVPPDSPLAAIPADDRAERVARSAPDSAGEESGWPGLQALAQDEIAGLSGARRSAIQRQGRSARGRRSGWQILFPVPVLLTIVLAATAAFLAGYFIGQKDAARSAVGTLEHHDAGNAAVDRAAANGMR